MAIYLNPGAPAPTAMPLSVGANVFGADILVSGLPTGAPADYSAVQAGDIDVMAWQGPAASKSLVAQVAAHSQADVLRDANGFYDLEGFVGLVSAGQRADSSFEHRVEMSRFYAGLLEGNIEAAELSGELDARGVPIPAIRVDSDVNQTYDERRSVVELSSNALDASQGDVDVQLKNGAFTISDSGVGMSPETIITRLLIPKLSGKPDVEKQIGRFGIGFYTAFRHLKGDGDRVIVETKAEGGKAYRLTFVKIAGRIKFKPEVCPVSSIAVSGTRVTVKAADIDKKRMIDELHRYLRYVNPDRRLIVNGEQFNAAKLTEVRAYGYGESGQARLLINPEGKAGLFVVKAGHLIIEQYEAESSQPETIIELPYSIPLSIRRDAVGVDENLASFMQRFVNDIKDPSVLVELFGELDERSNDKFGFMAMLCERAKRQTDDAIRKNPELRVYPDTPAMRKNIEAGANTVFVHPALYHPGWLDRFEKPREFRGGYSIEDSGANVPLTLVLSDDVTGAYYYDRKSAVIYLNRDYYRQSAPFVLSALFMVENLRFHVAWCQDSVEAALDVFDGGQDSASNPQTSAGDSDKLKTAAEMPAVAPVAVRPDAPQSATAKKPKNGNAIVEFLKAHNLKPTDFGRRFKGLTFSSGDECHWGSKVRDLSTGKLGFARGDGRLILPAKYDEIIIDESGDGFYLHVKLNGRYGFFDKDGRQILPVKYAAICSIHHFHDRDCVFAFDVDTTVNLYDMNDGKPLLRKGLWVISILSKFEHSCVAYRYRRDGKWGVLDLNDHEVVPARCDEVEEKCGAGLSVFLRSENGSILEGLVSVDGREIIPPKDRYISYAVVGGKDYAAVQGKDGKYGVIDLEGHEILPAVYSEITFEDDFIVVGQNGKYGLFDIGGRMIIPAVYDGIYVYGDRIMVKQNDKRGLFDIGGNVILPICHERVEELSQRAGEDTRYFKISQNGRWGLCDRNGRQILPPEYDSIVYSKGYIYVLKNNLNGLLDMDCNVILPVEYRDICALDFGDRVYFEAKRGNTHEVIDKDRNVVLSLFPTDKIEHKIAGGRHYLMITGASEQSGLLDENFDVLLQMRDYSFIQLKEETVLVRERGSDEYALYTLDGRLIVDNVVNSSNKSPIIVQQGYRYLFGLYDGKGNEILPCEFNDIERCDLGPYVKACKNGRWGIYDMDGNEVIPVAWDYASIIGSGGAGQSIAVHDRSGTVVIPFAMIERIMKSDALRARFNELRKKRIAVNENVAAIANASDVAWQVIISDRRKLPLLPHLADPVNDAYVCRHPNADAKTLDRAFALINEFRGFASGDINTFLNKIDALMGSTIDMGKVVKDIRTGRKSVDIEAIGIYLATRGAVFLEEGKLNIQPADGRFHRLSDVVTALRLTRTPGIGTMTDARRYNNEEDWRQVNHAVHNIYSLDPYAYIRELMQNSLDVQNVPGRVAEGSNKIEFETMRVGGRLVVRMRDYGGMTEDEFIGLVKPGSGTKADDRGALGGFGVGFYAALADANWLRLRTAIRGSREVVVADFRVIRDNRGHIADIEMGVRCVKNKDKFYGTEIETERFASIPELEVARIEARFRDVSQYVSRHMAHVSYNGDVVNGDRNGPLVVANGKTIGRVELYDGLEERLLLGGLPLSALPKELSDSVPDVVKRFFERHGFYVNLDHRAVKPTPTRDRLRNHDAVMAELADILPALLIRGFLERVADSRYAEDLKQLPEMYFVEFYNMAGRSLFDASIVRDANAINNGRFGDFDAARYAKKDGEHDILKLLTLIRFIPVNVNGRETKVSLRDIRLAFERSIKGDSEARALVEACKNSAYLPASVKKKLAVAVEHHTFAEAARRYLNSWMEKAEPANADEKGRYARNSKYGLGDVKDAKHRLHLSLLQTVAQMVYRRHGGIMVRAGIHTIEDDLTAYAHHYAMLGVYHIYRPLGDHLNADAFSLYNILTMEDETRARANFERYLAALYEVAAHELTHAVKEHGNEMTHAPKFYEDQMAIISEALITPDETSQLFNKYRAMAIGQVVD